MSTVGSSPLKKRRKLSLKVPRKCPEDDIPNAEKSEPISSTTETDTETKCGILQKESNTETDIQSNETDIQSEEFKSGPGIIGFENLGNTCFLNSVLQILRYTPGFLDGLEILHKDVIAVEKLRREINEELKKERNDECEKSGENLSLQVVKSLHQLFTRMENREKKFRQLGGSVVATMTVKPDRLLEILRRINPMFEGYLQHDAQELLRCLLCYLQDAWKENGKIRTKYKELEKKRRKSNELSINNINKYFGKACANQKKATPKAKSCKEDVKMALFTEKMKPNGNEKLEIKPCGRDAEMQEGEINHANSSPENNDKTNIPHSHEHFTPDQKQSLNSYDETDSMLCSSNSVTSPVCSKNSISSQKLSPDTPVSSFTCISGADDSGGRRRTRRSNGTPSPVNSDSVVKSVSTNRRGSKRKKTEIRKDQDNLVKVKSYVDTSASLETVSDVKELGGCSSSQPSVLSMFGKREIGCKRLGMRGAIVGKVHNGVEAPESLHDKPALETVKLTDSCLPDHTGDGPSVIPEPVFTVQDDASLGVPNSLRHSQDVLSALGRSPAKRCPGVLEHVSETNLKSAALQDIKQATVKLEKCDNVCNSPLKSVSANEAIKKLGMPAEKQKDFVEHLFQGMMMLRTRCIECEGARERQEVFQDVSVPLKTASASEEDGLNDSDEEPEESSLSCLMSAFTDVERLCDDNKYFCENCVRYVEAERSLHYETLPEILTLHLKRFAASSGYFGNLTKINDHVATPEYLPCLRYKCPRPCHRQDHRYKLFGLIAHSGMSITSGHYMSYVRLLQDSRPVQNLRVKTEKKYPGASGIPTLLGKMKVKSEMGHKDGENAAGQCATGCARGSAALPEDGDQVQKDNHKLSDEEILPTCDDNVQPVKTEQEDKIENSITSDSECNYASEDCVNKWLECDDDFIQVLDDEDFDRRLAPNSGYNATPYVLFYIKDKDAF